MLKSLFFLFFVFLSINGNATWHFNGSLKCRLESFTYRMQVWEEDLIEQSDDLLTDQAEVFSHFPHRYQIDASDDHDGFDPWKKFEIYIIIIHNCNPLGNRKKIKHDCGTYDINAREITQTQDFDIYNQGENV